MITQVISILFSVYMVLWIASYVDNGLLESEDASKDIYQRIMLFSMAATGLVTPFVGYIADNLHWGFNIGTAFTLRFLTGLLFLQINDPRTTLAIFLCVLYTSSSAIANISIETGYLRGISSEIRGTMFGLFWLFAFTGVVLFTLAAGYLHDKVGAKSPFELLLGLDGVYLFAVITLGLCGKLK